MKTRFLFFWLLIYIYFIVYIITSPDDIGNNADNISNPYAQILSGILILYACFFSFTKLGVILKHPVNLSFFYFLIYILFAFILHSLEYPSTFVLQIMGVSKILYWIIPLFFLYYYFPKIPLKKRVSTLKFLSVIYIIFTAILIYRQLNVVILSDRLSGVNAAGKIPFVLPILYCTFSKRKFGWLYLLCWLLVLVSMKRSPILLMGLTFPFFYKELFTAFSKKEIGLLLLLSLIIIVPRISFFVEKLEERNRLEVESGTYGSGRSVFYLYALEGFKESKGLDFFFGHGEGGINLYLDKTFGIPISAHNGFLNMMYNYGLIGIIMYISLFVVLWRRINFFSNDNKRYRKVYILSLITFLYYNIVSHGYQDNSNLLLGVLWAYLFSLPLSKSNIIEYKNKPINL